MFETKTSINQLSIFEWSILENWIFSEKIYVIIIKNSYKFK